MRFLLLLLLAVSTALGQNIVNSTNRDKIFYPETYGARPDDGINDKEDIQEAIDAAEAAGGGIVMLNEGVWEVHPLATGLGLLVNGDKVILRGTGPKSIIRGISDTSSATFELIAAEGYNTATTSYGASGIHIESLRLECDGYLYSADNSRINAHGLIGIVHCPWAVIRDVEFGNVCFHQIEIQRSRNVLIERCVFRGSSESSRIQFDSVGAAGQASTSPPETWSENILIKDCRFASRSMTGVTVGGQSAAMIELDHTGDTLLRNLTFDNCEFGVVHLAAGSSASYYGIAINSGSAGLARLDNLTIQNCRFLGNGLGTWQPVYLLPVTGSGAKLSGVTIRNNAFTSGYDCDGMRCAGGFYRAIVVGLGTTGTALDGGTTTTTDYTLKSGIVIEGNKVFQRFVQGITAVTSGRGDLISVSACLDAKIVNNSIWFLPYDGAVASADNGTDVITTTLNHGLEVGDTIRFTGGSLPGNIALATTYYVRSVTGLTTFTISETNGGPLFNIGATGTGTWTMYNSSVAVSYQIAFLTAQIPNLTFTGNLVHMEHGTTLNGLFYTVQFDSSGIEALSVPGYWEVSNNKIHQIGAGTLVYSFKEYAGAAFGSGGPFVRGRFIGNTVVGSTVLPVLTGHPEWAPPLAPRLTAGALDATGTLTAALIRGGIVTSTTAAAVAATPDTGTLIDAASSGLLVNGYLEFTVINTGANNFTVGTATGVTTSGNMVVAATSSGKFLAKKTAAATYVIYRQ